MASIDITSLPDTLLIAVFKYFPQAELCRNVRLVCQKWHELSFDLDLWKRVDLKDQNDNLTDVGLVHLLSQIGHHIEHLDLRFCSSVSRLSFCSTKVNCPNLKTIDITETNAPEQSQRELFTNTDKFPVLESVIWESNEKISMQDFYKLYCEAYQVGRKFTTITNPYPTGLDPDHTEDDVNPGLLQVAALFTQLHTVTVKRANLHGATLEILCKANPGIQTVIVPECMWLSDNIARSLSHLTTLTELDISATVTSDAELIKTVSHQPGLQKINISACSRITDVGIIKLAETCRNLTHFIANELQHQNGTITDNGLCTIAENCLKLKALSLTSCPNVTDVGIQAVTARCSRLEFIDLAKCLTLTNLSFLAISENCPELKTLKASECVKITSVSVNAIVKQCKKLHELELDTCHYLSRLHFQEEPEEPNENTTDDHDDASIHYTIQQSLISSPCRIRVLDLSYCSNIATDSVKQIAAHCVTLRHLSLRGCYLITDHAIEAVAEKCLLLTILDISGSTMNHSKLSDRSLTALADHSRNLVMLSLTKTSMTTNGILQVVQRCRTLTRIKVEAGAYVNVNEVIKGAGAERKTCRIQGHSMYLSHNAQGPVMLAMPPLDYAI